MVIDPIDSPTATVSGRGYATSSFRTRAGGTMVLRHMPRGHARKRAVVGTTTTHVTRFLYSGP